MCAQLWRVLEPWFAVLPKHPPEGAQSLPSQNRPVLETDYVRLVIFKAQEALKEPLTFPLTA